MSGDLERRLVSSYQYMDGILKAMRGNEIIQGEGPGETRRVQGLSPEAANTWRAAEEEAWEKGLRGDPRGPEENPPAGEAKPKDSFKTERVVNHAIGILPTFCVRDLQVEMQNISRLIME